jgi:hypothetical protein
MPLKHKEIRKMVNRLGVSVLCLVETELNNLILIDCLFYASRLGSYSQLLCSQLGEGMDLLGPRWIFY